MKGLSRGAFVTDLDGTLLQNGRLGQVDLDAWQELGRQNILRVIATGRSLHSLQRTLPDDFPLDYAILSTGNVILDWHSGNIVHSARITPAEALNIAGLLVDLDIGFMLHEDLPTPHRFWFHPGRNPASDFMRRLELHRSYGTPWAAQMVTDSVSQFVAIIEAEQQMLAKRVEQELAMHSVIRATSPLDDSSVWVEIFGADVSKSRGIRRILDHVGQPDLPVAAIGNDYNDMDMLDFADISFRVCNAFLEEKPTYITTPCEQGAVAYAVRHFTQYLSLKMNHA